MHVGILAIQGDVEAHAKALAQLGATTQPVLREKDLAQVDALVLPGGESTTIAKGLARLELYGPLAAFCESGKPILGTCAGAILLARKSDNHPVKTLGLIDLVAHRNAYGTQVDSFAAVADVAADDGEGAHSGAHSLDGLRCVFIRAPRFSDLGPEVEVLVRVEGNPVLVRQGNVIACSFHPELGHPQSGVDTRVHQLLDPA
ncbi:MAG: 5'-phosphate synthase pdxT subunit [Myxococcota bacterium]|jgi:5'-phosphate synthase pdxT subunit